MADLYRILITPRALTDLRGIFQYIQQHSPQNARAMIRRLLDAIDALNMLPHRYGVPRVGRVADRQIRSMPVRPFLVRYRIDDSSKAVFVLRIRHGARR